MLSALSPAVSGAPAPPPDRGTTLSRRPDPHAVIRLTVLLFVFCLWALLIVLRLAQFMIFDRSRTLEAMHREALFEGVVPAARGRILDRDGRPLAWSERLFTVHWRVPRTADQAAELLALLSSEPWLTEGLPQPLSRELLGARIELARDLPVERAIRLDGLADQVPGLEVSSGFRRRVAALPGLRESLGRVRCGADGAEVGVSGYELEYDDLLRGLPGAFHVMLDKDGRWLPETWQKVSELRPGLDVQLPLRLPPREDHAP